MVDAQGIEPWTLTDAKMVHGTSMFFLLNEMGKSVGGTVPQPFRQCELANDVLIRLVITEIAETAPKQQYSGLR